MGMRVSLLSMDEVWELGGVTQEENWGIVEHPVQVTLLSLQFDRETWEMSTVGTRNPGREA